MSDISIYVHFPFCKKKCAYCAFYSVCVKSDAIFDAYSDALCRQIAALPAFCAKTIYFGGGTPTLMGARRLCRMLDKIFAAVSISADCEITFETNPNTVDLGMLKYLKVAGFNRVSAGLQSTDRDTLKLLGRTHTAADFTRFYSDATDSGFDNIAVDIMFALPSKTGDELAKTIEYVKTLD
ncbi:MAG: radical SAM protein, partial [Clostridia bacterium]